MTKSASNTVERKTDTKTNNPNGDTESNKLVKTKVKKNLLPNVLNNYRSVTYNFTMSAVPDDWLDDAKYRIQEPKYVILKSGGKGTKNFALPENLSAIQKQTIEDTAYNDNFGKVRQEVIEEKTQKDLLNNQGLVEGFNKSSPGRFDMFIDDLEIQGIMTPGTANGASLASKLSFTIVEPYSTNGFIEALHVASVSAGYTTYAAGAFLLKIEFWGYKDDVDVKESRPEIIEKATKFLLFGFSSVKVELTAQGTKYQCTATMFTDRAFGNPNKLKKPISMQGSTVKEVLEDLCNNLMKQVEQSDNESKPGSSKNHDRYEIKFPVLENGKFTYPPEGNKIGQSKLAEFNKSSILSAMPDQATSNNPSPRTDGKKVPSTTEVKQDPNKLKYTPSGASKIQFNAGRNLNECIEAVIVDSNYVKSLLENFNPDENGLVNYFLITPEVKNLDVINPQTKDYYKKYTYNVSEYKVHYSRIPGYQSLKFDSEKLVSMISKEYNYSYTGKNIDVLNFRLDFNNLYFESIPFALANNDVFGARNSAANDDTPNVSYKSEDPSKVAKHATPVQATRSSPTEINPEISGTGGQLTDDPYQILARNMHEAIINAGVSGSKGDLEILGDPYFISTTGTGNYKAKLQDGSINVTEDNEIDVTFGEVYIMVIFRNPVDVNQFEKIRVPFSGVYIITNLKSHFKNGVFKQDLSLIRIPAQIPLDDNMKETDPKSVSVTTPDPTNQTVNDSTPAISGPGIRPDPTQLAIPTVNSAAYNLAGKFLNPISQGLSQLSAASSVYSLATSRLTEGIRLASNTLNAPLQSLSQLKSSAETLGSSLGNQLTSVENAFSTFANSSAVGGIVKSLSNTADLVGGIGAKLESQVKEQSLGKLAGTLGIDINKLDSVAKEKFQGLKDKAEELSVTLPRAVASGLQIDKIPLEKFKNIPSFPPDAVAPMPDIPLKDLKGLDVAKAFGVTNLSKLPGGITPDKINEAIAAADGLKSQVLSAKNALTSDLTALKDKFGSVAQQATGALGQVSQTLESAQASLGNLNIKSASSLFGSNNASSPLDKLITPLAQQIKLPPTG